MDGGCPNSVASIEYQLPVEYDPFRPCEDPYGVYRRLRDEEPVYRNEERNFWALTRFDDVQMAARRWETFSSAAGNDLDDTAKLFEPAGELTHADPPLHTRLRDGVRREFSPKAVRKRLEPAVQAKVAALLERLVGRSEVDLAQEFARPLPAGMVCQWLGFPERDHPKLLEWFEAMMTRVPERAKLPSIAFEGRDAMRTYIEHAIASRRKREGDDLLSALVRAQRNDELTADEVIGVSMLLFVAGIVTTTGLIANSLLALSRFPDQRELLVHQPERIPTAIEEFLRYEAPIQWLARTSTSSLSIHGREIPVGERVILIWASANRDERRWSHPDRLDVLREPKRHVSFGEGIHHCLGAPLARLEGRIAFEQFLTRFPNYHVTGPVERVYSPMDRGIARLPVRLESVASALRA